MNPPPIQLNSTTIERVREGVAAAQNPLVRDHIHQSLDHTKDISSQNSNRYLAGRIRKFALRTFIHTLFNLKVENPEYIPQGPAILAPNHLSHIDPFLLLAEVPQSPYYYILGDARTLYNKGWKRHILSLTGGVLPLERLWKEEVAVIEAAQSNRPDLAELAQSIQKDVRSGGAIQTLRQIDRTVQGILSQGDGLLLFPEGRLGETEGQLHLPLKRGTAIYALRSGVPIIPVVLIGTQDLYLRKTLTMRFGPPIPVALSKRPKSSEVKEVLTQLQTALQSLLPKNYHEPTGIKLFQHALNHMLW